ELVGLGGQRLEVGDAEVAGPGGERVAESERGQRRVAPGRPAPDAEPVGVDPALLAQPPGSGLAVVEVDHAPVALELVAVGPAVADRSAVVDVDHGEAPAGPVLGVDL